MITKEELIQKLIAGDVEALKGKPIRMTRVRVPGKEVNLAHVMTPQETTVYHNLGLHIGVHEGEDHTGETLGIMSFTPWESTIVACDVATKAADVQIGFMDRFCGTLIITGERTPVETAVEEVLKFFNETLGFHTCKMHKS